MNEQESRRTWDKEGKSAAVVQVLSYIMSNGPEVGNNCVKSDAYARDLFDNANVGNIDVPDTVRITFVPINDRKKQDKGSIVVELPSMSSNQVGLNQLSALLDYADSVSLTDLRPWNKYGKPFAIYSFLSHLVKYPNLRERCLHDDAYVRWLFEHKEIGNTQIPRDVKVIVVPEGEMASGEFGSLIIECPEPNSRVPVARKDGTPHPLLGYVLCCYHLWRR